MSKCQFCLWHSFDFSRVFIHLKVTICEVSLIDHPLPTLPTTKTGPLGVGGGLWLLKWSVGVSPGLCLWSRTRPGVAWGPGGAALPDRASASHHPCPLASPLLADDTRNLWHSAPGPFDCFILELVYIMKPCRTKFCVYIFKRKSVFK